MNDAQRGGATWQSSWTGIPGSSAKKVTLSSGALNAPWGPALAPADFGALSNTPLVANSGDGRINSYDLDTGRLIGPVLDSTGTPIQVPGLRGIAFPDDSSSMSKVGNDILFYTAAGADPKQGCTWTR
jgi:uncharacterized protein (TIGR03118 family)